ncbi:hypothetical protein JMJ77_0005332 [Colletotrichum scovillei]|uniref:Uncharacterized protein n=1 Tax=Colletotrichum scovillei TaxID=1209932 RepID=A0A9P7RGS5_9PEZI|nr:hypothetical protein JMJ77_0005332 [Colletotrichum scovillei]KAG7076548.1 hypothetical protein JMJ76_0013811 [Colletotrichum scovillei]KAG7083624.1 hypothetical protein JMJ78_0009069 [Colletotrichum scovillei]
MATIDNKFPCSKETPRNTEQSRAFAQEGLIAALGRQGRDLVAESSWKCQACDD